MAENTTNDQFNPDRYILELPELISIANGDSLPIQQESGGDETTFHVRAVTLANFIKSYLEAPVDNNAYVRKNGQWVLLSDELP